MSRTCTEHVLSSTLSCQFMTVMTIKFGLENSPSTMATSALAMALPTRHTADGTLLIAMIMCSGARAPYWSQWSCAQVLGLISLYVHDQSHRGLRNQPSERTLAGEARDDAGRIERLRKVSITGEFSLPIVVPCPSRLFSLLSASFSNTRIYGTPAASFSDCAEHVLSCSRMRSPLLNVEHVLQLWQLWNPQPANCFLPLQLPES